MKTFIKIIILIIFVPNILSAAEMTVGLNSAYGMYDPIWRDQKHFNTTKNYNTGEYYDTDGFFFERLATEEPKSTMAALPATGHASSRAFASVLRERPKSISLRISPQTQISFSTAIPVVLLFIFITLIGFRFAYYPCDAVFFCRHIQTIIPVSSKRLLNSLTCSSAEPVRNSQRRPRSIRDSESTLVGEPASPTCSGEIPMSSRESSDISLSWNADWRPARSISLGSAAL